VISTEILELLLSIGYIVLGYLIGMAFAGSFLGRKYMGLMDILLHKVFRRRVTVVQYLYWKYFCGIGDPPKPENLKKLEGRLKQVESLLTGLLALASSLGERRT